MPTFVGLDVCLPDPETADHSRLCYCEAAVTTERKGVEIRESLIRNLPLRPLIADLTDRLRLDEKPPAKINFPGDETSLIERQVRRHADELTRFFGDRSIQTFQGRAAAFPYSASPPIRLVLPLLLNPDLDVKSIIKRARGWDSIEAPLAGCLALVAEGRVAPPANVALLSHAPARCGNMREAALAGAELTAVQLTADGSDLGLRVRAWLELDLTAEAPSIEQQLVKWPTEVGQGNSPLWCLYPELEEKARQIARTFQLAPEAIHCAAPETVAMGAARYAAVRFRRHLDGTRFERVKIERLMPRTLGVVGCNRQGDLFWRRILDAGTPLYQSGTEKMLIDAQGIPDPPILMLAEAARPTLVPPPWIAQSQWTRYELALFATEQIQMQRRPSERLDYTLNIDFENPSGPFAWTKKTLEVSLQQLNRGDRHV
jgi:hypothetical protein